ncbi:MAG: HD domain-containing protein, partial [Clostridiales bacterium]|nr:HD domain-containing protein [Clostridiales bacterium]
MRISRNQLLFAFSECLDYVESLVGTHHYDTAYIALHILNEMDLPYEQLQDILTAALIHDVGVFSRNTFEKIRNYAFEDEDSHSHIGYSLLKDIPYYSHFVETILYHHANYEKNKENKIPLSSYIIFLADRLTFLIKKSPKNLDLHRKYVLDTISKDMNKRFNPILYPYLKQALEKDSFWMYFKENVHKDIVKDAFKYDNTLSNFYELKNFLRLFGKVVDYKSPFTTTHSVAVSKIAPEIGAHYNLPNRSLENLEIAGLIHDIGKLAIDNEILEKPGSLTAEEYETMKTHILYTDKILKSIDGFSEIREIAISHHEKNDGSGYPNRKTEKDLSPEQKILIVSDLFTAMTEDRPYRESLSKECVLKILKEMEIENKISKDINDIVFKNIDILYKINQEVHIKAQQEYA